MIKIVGGLLKGHLLKTPNTLETRPTLARTREAIMSSLGERLTEARVLDLFSGVGSYGLEAISRGSTRVVFVENSKEVFPYLENNVSYFKSQLLKMDVPLPEITTIKNNVEIFLNINNQKFDIIFSDPPYDDFIETSKYLAHKLKSFLNPYGVWVSESETNSNHDKIQQHISESGWILQKSKKYGRNNIDFWIFKE